MDGATPKLAQYTVFTDGPAMRPPAAFRFGTITNRASARREESMAHIVILGAGLGGMPMAYEMRELAR